MVYLGKNFNPNYSRPHAAYSNKERAAPGRPFRTNPPPPSAALGSSSSGLRSDALPGTLLALAFGRGSLATRECYAYVLLSDPFTVHIVAHADSVDNTVRCDTAMKFPVSELVLINDILFFVQHARVFAINTLSVDKVFVPAAHLVELTTHMPADTGPCTLLHSLVVTEHDDFLLVATARGSGFCAANEAGDAMRLVPSEVVLFQYYSQSDIDFVLSIAYCGRIQRLGLASNSGSSSEHSASVYIAGMPYSAFLCEFRNGVSFIEYSQTLDVYRYYGPPGADESEHCILRHWMSLEYEHVRRSYEMTPPFADYLNEVNSVCTAVSSRDQQISSGFQGLSCVTGLACSDTGMCVIAYNRQLAAGVPGSEAVYDGLCAGNEQATSSLISSADFPTQYGPSTLLVIDTNTCHANAVNRHMETLTSRASYAMYGGAFSPHTIDFQTMTTSSDQGCFSNYDIYNNLFTGKEAVLHIEALPAAVMPASESDASASQALFLLSLSNGTVLRLRVYTADSNSLDFKLQFLFADALARHLIHLHRSLDKSMKHQSSSDICSYPLGRASIIQASVFRIMRRRQALPSVASNPFEIHMDPLSIPSVDEDAKDAGSIGYLRCACTVLDQSQSAPRTAVVTISSP